MMRKTLPGILVVAVVLAAGCLFYLLPGIGYTLEGATDGAQVIGTIMSTCYFLVFISAATWLGYKKCTPGFVAFGIVFMVIGVMGLMGYMGYGFLLGGAASIYFLFIAPFAAIIDALALSWNMYYAADGFMLVVPLVIYFLSMVFYILGTILRAHRRALTYSLMRINRHYEYRLPLEEVYAAVENSRQKRYTA